MLRNLFCVPPAQYQLFERWTGLFVISRDTGASSLSPALVRVHAFSSTASILRRPRRVLCKAAGWHTRSFLGRSVLALRLTDAKGKGGSAFSFHAHHQHPPLVPCPFTNSSLANKSILATAMAGGAHDQLSLFRWQKMAIEATVQTV